MLNFFRRKMNNKKGFTLIELIVVIAILAILALMAIPRLAGFTETARQANDREAAVLVCNAAAMYHASNPTDNDITTAELIAAQLINANDIVIQSVGYTAAANTFKPALAADIVSVTLVPGATPRGAQNYTISK